MSSHIILTAVSRYLYNYYPTHCETNFRTVLLLNVVGEFQYNANKPWFALLLRNNKRINYIQCAFFINVCEQGVSSRRQTR